MSSEVAELLQELIRNECVNDGSPESGHEFRSVDTLASYFGRPGFVVEPAPGRQSVVYRLEGVDADAPRLLLMGHLDVVPVTRQGWSRDPFGGEIADGFVWGRGAVDMLNLTSAMAVVFKQFLDGSLPRPHGDLLFLGVADEEAGGTYGAEFLVDHHWDEVRCEYLLTEIAFPSIATAAGPAAVINVGEKGPYWQTVHSRGTPGHGSQPYGTDNALVPLARAVAALADAGTPVAISPEWRRFVAALDLDPDLKRDLVDPESVDRAIDALAEIELGMARYAHACTHMTVTPTILSSGTKANVIPDAGEASLDGRLLPGQDGDTVHSHLAKVLGGDYDRLDFRVERTQPASSSPPEGLLWEALVAAFGRLAGSDLVVPALTPAATDARFFRSKGAVTYGAGWFDERVGFTEFLSMVHGNDERISLGSLDRTTRLLTETVQILSDKLAVR